MQMMAVCGHRPNTIPDKVVSSEPAIEAYLLPLVKVNQSCYYKDMWQGGKFPVDMIYPPKNIDFTSNNTSYHLQLPNDSYGMMECIYGNWTVKSSEHAGLFIDCRHYKKLNITLAESPENKTTEA